MRTKFRAASPWLIRDRSFRKIAQSLYTNLVWHRSGLVLARKPVEVGGSCNIFSESIFHRFVIETGCCCSMSEGFTDGSSVVFNVFAKYSFMYSDRPDRWSDREKLFKVSFEGIELNSSSDDLQCGVHTQIGFHRHQFERK